MRWSSILIPVASMLLAWPAAGQTSVAPASRTFASAADVQALIARARGVVGQPGVVEDIVASPPFAVHLEYRTAVSPARIHETDAELFYVIDGAGTAIVGGVLKDGTRTDAANLSGPEITGGTRTQVSKGDVLIVPQGAPHQFLPGSTGALVLMSIHLPRAAAAH